MSRFCIAWLGVMLNVVMLNVVVLNVSMLSVMVPFMNVDNKLDCLSLESFSSLV